jgi:branched-chain amino acid transport system substrate-binding protein
MAQAAQLAIDEHNSTQAIPIATTVVDDTGTPDCGIAVAEQIAAQPDVFGVIGHYNSDVTIAASAVYARAGLAMITPIASNPVVTDRHLPGIFRWTNRDDRTATAIAAYLRGARRKRRAIIIESETAYGASMAAQFHRAFTAAGGEVLLHRTIATSRRKALARGAGKRYGDLPGRADPPNSPNRSSSNRPNTTSRPPAPNSPPTRAVHQPVDTALDALVRDLPREFDLLFYGGSFDGAPLLKTMRSAGLSQLFAAGDGCWDVANFVEPAGPDAAEGEGVLVLAAALAVGCMKDSADFATRYTARYGPIGNYALNAYDSTCLLIDALIDATHSARGAAPDRSRVIDAIRQSRYQGLAYRDPVRWNDKGDNLTSLTALNIIRDGRFQQIAEIAAT